MTKVIFFVTSGFLYVQYSTMEIGEWDEEPLLWVQRVCENPCSAVTAREPPVERTGQNLPPKTKYGVSVVINISSFSLK